MPGRPGRSGGHNRKSLAELRLMGSFRPGRHRHLLEAPPPRPQEPFDWAPTPDELARLGPQGRAFVDSALAAYDHNFLAGAVLLDAAATIDRLATLRQEIATTGIVITNKNGTTRANPLLSAELSASRYLMRLLKWLKVG